MFIFNGVGLLVKEVDVREVGENKVATFNIVTNRGVKRGETWENIPTFIEVKAWGRLAETAQKLQPKDLVQVSGSLEQEHWLGKDGSKRSKIIVNANNIKAIRPFIHKDESDESLESRETVPF
jgi:single stranded DNA-binding protein